jgi:hypothetical protein
VLEEFLQERTPSRRNRRLRRAVKRKMSNFPLRRKSNPPLPPCDLANAIKIIN